jgi:hypothetical protein
METFDLTLISYNFCMYVLTYPENNISVIVFLPGPNPTIVSYNASVVKNLQRWEYIA